jgi:hypothetical protein
MKPESGPPVRRLFDLLASLRVGVVAMVVLAVACAAATFYESVHGTAAAQRAFYATGWFTFVLSLLGVNILLSMLKRYPWRRHQAGFVMAHVGIVMLLVGSLVSVHRGVDGSLALYQGERSDRMTTAGKTVTAALDHGAATLVAEDIESRPPSPDRPRRAAVAGASLVLDDYAPHVEVHESIADGEQGPPAVHYVLAGSFGEQHGWLVAGGEQARADFGPLLLTLVEAGSSAGVAKALRGRGANEIAFVQTPEGTLRYALVRAQGGATSGAVEVGKAQETPWMGMTVTVERALRHAVPVRDVRPAAPPAKESRRRPAVRAHVDGGAPEWIPYGETAHLGGERHLDVSFGDAQASLPFAVTLLRFKSDKYPGSNMPATYESRVRVDDPAQGASEHVIAMNRPLHYAGYTFFQASYIPGEPMGSVLSVSRSPGLPLVYAGTALVTLGIAWMVYLRPLLVRREAARTAAARAGRRETALPRPLTGVPAGAGGAR